MENFYNAHLLQSKMLYIMKNPRVDGGLVPSQKWYILKCRKGREGKTERRGRAGNKNKREKGGGEQRGGG